jgi:hypothetical protein
MNEYVLRNKNITRFTPTKSSKFILNILAMICWIHYFFSFTELVFAYSYFTPVQLAVTMLVTIYLPTA